jgi:hypothetical protein
MVTEDEAHGEPGWKVGSYSSKDGEWWIPSTMISSDQASVIGQAFEDATKGFKKGIVRVTPTNIIVNGNARIKEALEAELKFAEEQAKRVVGLRKRLEE